MDTSADYKAKALAFLQSHTVTVLSTVSPENKAQAAVIYTRVDENFNFFFITKSNTAKAKNLEANSSAALTIVDPASFTTIQATGSVTNMQSSPDYTSLFFKTAETINASPNPPVAMLKNAGDAVLYKFEPTWLRYADFSEANKKADFEIFHQIIPQSNS